jgi:thiol-disulfide isomerase/thioredoxin
MRRATRFALAVLALLCAARAVAAPVEDFTATTWARWQKELPRPAIVVFSTTYCPTCPDVMASLAASVKEAGARVPLIVVVMDADGRREFAHAAHFRMADRIFAFRGPEAALRFSVDPRWRGVTPYVALFGAQGAPTLTPGQPSAAQLRPLWSLP